MESRIWGGKIMLLGASVRAELGRPVNMFSLLSAVVSELSLLLLGKGGGVP